MISRYSARSHQRILATLSFQDERRSTGKNFIPKSVRFEQEMYVYWLPHKSDFLEDHQIESEAIWYSRAELGQIKEDFTNTLRMILHDENVLDMDIHCPRGLEGRTPNGSKQRRKSRNAARDAVMKEQSTQWEMNSVDAVYRGDIICNTTGFGGQERIANACRRHSGVCQVAARRLGIRDEREARSFRIRNDGVRKIEHNKKRLTTPHASSIRLTRMPAAA